MKLATKPLVAVLWNDAHGMALGDYTDAEIDKDFHKPVQYLTCGLLLRDDESGITVCMDQGYEEGKPAASFRNLGFIPRGMVIEVVQLGVPARKAARKVKALSAPIEEN